jgi:hypothetical protein
VDQGYFIAFVMLESARIYVLDNRQHQGELDRHGITGLAELSQPHFLRCQVVSGQLNPPHQVIETGFAHLSRVDFGAIGSVYHFFETVSGTNRCS